VVVVAGAAGVVELLAIAAPAGRGQEQGGHGQRHGQAGDGRPASRCSDHIVILLDISGILRRGDISRKFDRAEMNF
jgi:hypothetical protein